MKAEDYLELPKRIENTINIRFSDSLKKQYLDFEREKVLEMFGDDTEITAINAAALMNKLLQFANGAIYDVDRNIHEVHDLKIEAVKELLEDGENVLIAWTYRHDMFRLEKALRKFKPRILKDDSDVVDWNAGRVRILMMHPASGGHGLNLQTGGNHIIWFGQTWSLELYQQLNARLDRQGQKKAVVINHIVMKGTVDEDVIKALNRKDKKQESLMQAVKAKIQKYVQNNR